MAVAFTELTGLASNTDAGTYTTASVTLTAGNLYLFGISVSRNTPLNPSAVATTGGAVTFALINTPVSYLNTPGYADSIWWVVPGSTVTDTVLVTRSTATGIGATLLEVTGATTPTPIVQSKYGTADATAALTTTLDSNLVAGNARFSWGGTSVNNTLVPTSGTWTQGTIRTRTTPVGAGKAAWNINPATTDKSVIWTPGVTASVGACIIEIAAAAAGGETTFMGAIPL